MHVWQMVLLALGSLVAVTLAITLLILGRNLIGKSLVWFFTVGLAIVAVLGFVGCIVYAVVIDDPKWLEIAFEVLLVAGFIPLIGFMLKKNTFTNSEGWKKGCSFGVVGCVLIAIGAMMFIIAPSNEIAQGIAVSLLLIGLFLASLVLYYGAEFDKSA